MVAVAEADRDVLSGCMLSRVDERFLRGTEQRQRGVGRQRPGGAVADQDGRQVTGP